MERIANLDTACGTNIDTPHEEKYRAYIDFLGREDVEKFIPYSKDDIKTVLEMGDTHLNMLPIKGWDRAAGYIENSRTGEITRLNTGLSTLVGKKVQSYSPSQCVSILKEAAIWRCERENARETTACSETVSLWVERFNNEHPLCSKEDLEAEIEDAKGAISNNRLWLKGVDTPEDALMYEGNIAEYEEYVSVLEEMKNSKENSDIER